MTITALKRLTVLAVNVDELSDVRVSLDLLSDGSYEFTDAEGMTVAVNSDEALRRLFGAFRDLTRE
jgi:hypothetical protein